MCNGTMTMYGWSIRKRDNCCASTYVSSAADIAFKKLSDRTGLR